MTGHTSLVTLGDSGMPLHILNGENRAGRFPQISTGKIAVLVTNNLYPARGKRAHLDCARELLNFAKQAGEAP